MSVPHIHDDCVARIRARLDRPIVLVGMMGTGKTRIGRLLSDALGLGFVNSDEEIEKAAGMSIADIFDRFGEPYFRDGERRVVRRLVEQGVQVVATGGGAMMNEDTAQLIRDKALSLWIKADLSVMVERTARNDRRPLLRHGDPKEILQELADKRYPVYAQADITIDSYNGPAEAMLGQALAKLEDFLNGRNKT